MRARFIAVLIAVAAVAVSAVGALPAAASAVVVAPQPEHVPGVRAATLVSVSCGSDTHCVAVGWQPVRGSGLHGLVESWNGTRWMRPRTANHQAALAGPDQLQRVSCAGPRSCVVVGSTLRGLLDGKPAQGGPAQLPIALREVDGYWRLSLPRQRRGALTVADLDAVACPSRAGCVAVGWGRAHGRQVGVVESLRHGQWRITHTVTVDGTQSALNDISCTGPGACVVTANGSRSGVGGRGQIGAVYRLAGDHLSRIAAAPGGDPWLLGVGCAPGGSCLTVGADTAATPTPIGFSVTARGASALPAPASAGAGTVTLRSVACAATTRCLAVGQAGAKARRGLAPQPGTAALEAWDGSAFAAQPATEIPSRPYGVACRPQFCMIVGAGADHRAAAARWLYTPPDAD